MRIRGEHFVLIVSTALILSLVSAVIAVYTPLKAFAAESEGVNALPATNIWYVDQDAAGSANGTSWSNAYNYLQAALADADTHGWRLDLEAVGEKSPEGSDHHKPDSAG